MTTEPADLREKLKAAIRQATDDGANTTEDYADAVLPIVREAQAEVLRDAAQAIEDSDKALPDLAIATAVRSLRFRADDMIEGDR